MRHNHCLVIVHATSLLLAIRLLYWPAMMGVEACSSIGSGRSIFKVSFVIDVQIESPLELAIDQILISLNSLLVA